MMSTIEILSGINMQSIGFNDFYRTTKLSPDSDDFFSWVRTFKSSSSGQSFLDFGVADAFLPLADKLSSSLSALAVSQDHHGYVYGHPEYEAACLKRATRYAGADLFLQVLPTSGAKSALNLLCLALINPGDVILVTTPAYPIFSIMAQRLGGKVIELPLLPENDFMPDLEGLDRALLREAKILVVNYPNNPTGKIASQQEWDLLLEICISHGILLINDAAYSDLLTETHPRGSLFRDKRAAGHCIEVHSLSKSLQIPGWRLGFILATPEIIEPLRILALLQESGQPKVLLDAVTQVIGDQQIMEEVSACVAERRDILVSILTEQGFNIANSNGAFFVYVQCPSGVFGGTAFSSSKEFSQYLASELGILTIPYQISGRSHVRFSVAFKGDANVIFDQLRRQLSSVRFIFSKGATP
ncbi:aminotransferase class I/II-fold pyridoxal phosphate-dependent enzyme [Pseudomonas sp. KFB-139]|uniref:Aminotransferase class I/II-fold pyridoxal phosphate-dependent enzyme n=1 Tax=Pseudomonas serbiensis TaxID=3064350 RepID=A0ABT9CN65_9PSED|nr:aminotransferase class I/II-fold pyridoxal phosphate-dependent enzyme [Pseudomonas sp. KFB-138]MDO7926845.1 aminotransferase class I/II-fold pyridoxal phosphate-dependent enzyme [Pseudomonas sp. KFB-138]